MTFTACEDVLLLLMPFLLQNAALDRILKHPRRMSRIEWKKFNRFQSQLLFALLHSLSAIDYDH